MKSLEYLLPLFLVAASNTAYHLISRATPSQASPFAALTAAYGIAFFVSALLLFLTRQGSAAESLQDLSLGNYLMGLVILGSEGGYLLMYRNGWTLSTANPTVNILASGTLFFIGALFLHESVSPKNVAGLILCASGIILMNKM